MKYKITIEDLNKRNHFIEQEGLTGTFLRFIEEQEKANNPILSTENISKLEAKTKKGIYFNIYALIILGLICLALGLHQFFYKVPLVGVNLYTQFPLISNGSIEIAGSILLIGGCVYSYLRRYSVLNRLVKSKLIEDLQQLNQEERHKPISVNKKIKRFRKPYKVGKKK